jgi:hypothetical protein
VRFLELPYGKTKKTTLSCEGVRQRNQSALKASRIYPGTKDRSILGRGLRIRNVFKEVSRNDAKAQRRNLAFLCAFAPLREKLQVTEA